MSKRDATRKECVACNIQKVPLYKCGGCRSVRYCSNDCQKFVWRTHKEECTRGAIQSYYKKNSTKEMFQMLVVMLSRTIHQQDSLKYGMIHGHLGDTYKTMGRFTDARHHYREQYNFSLVNDVKQQQGHAVGGRGDIFVHLGQHESAMVKYKEQLNLSHESGDQLMTSRVHSSMGIAEIRQGNFGLACNHAKRALKIAIDMNDGTGQQLAYFVLADVCTQQERLKDARNYCWQGRSVSVTPLTELMLGVILRYTCRTYMNAGETDAAVCAAEDYLQIVVESGNRIMEGETYKLLSILQAFKNDSGLSEWYNKKQLNILNELSNS
jgi:tetratricopeptide (TPR) repeat protein